MSKYKDIAFQVDKDGDLRAEGYGLIMCQEGAREHGIPERGRGILRVSDTPFPGSLCVEACWITVCARCDLRCLKIGKQTFSQAFCGMDELVKEVLGLDRDVECPEVVFYVGPAPKEEEHAR